MSLVPSPPIWNLARWEGQELVGLPTLQADGAAAWKEDQKAYTVLSSSQAFYLCSELRRLTPVKVTQDRRCAAVLCEQ